MTKAIKADPYFAHDETHVIAVKSVDDVGDSEMNRIFNGTISNVEAQGKL